MGGPGSTRWKGYSKKPLAERSLALDLHKLAHQARRDSSRATGAVSWTDPRTGDTSAIAAFAVVLSRDTQSVFHVLTRDYRSNPEPEVELFQTFALEWVPTLPGRGRYFARCPTCERRLTKVFWPEGRDKFECRTCAGVTNRSNQMEDKRVNRFRKDPEACLQALDGFGQRGKAGTQAWVALKALPGSLDPCGALHEARHPGGQRLMARWAPYLLAKIIEARELEPSS